MSYESIIKSISVGHADAPANRFSESEANTALKTIVQKTGAIALRNDRYESSRYFMYVGTFPCFHVAIDNRSGTTRIYTIYNEDDLSNILKKI